MRRAVLLIVILTLSTVSLGLWMDLSQQKVARQYLDGVSLLRELITQGKQEDALAEQAYLHASWQRDAKWLNCLISHHHTRAVTSGMMVLATALELDLEAETYQALDQLMDALRDVEQSDFPYLENIL